MGRLLAEAGHSVVFGGGADGLMGTCARGAKAAGIRREICRGRLRGEAEDLSVFQNDIQPRVDALRRVDDPSVSDQVFHTVPLLLLPSAMVLIVLSGTLRPPWPAAALRPGRFRGILPAGYRVNERIDVHENLCVRSLFQPAGSGLLP